MSSASLPTSQYHLSLLLPNQDLTGSNLHCDSTIALHSCSFSELRRIHINSSSETRTKEQDAKGNKTQGSPPYRSTGFVLLSSSLVTTVGDYQSLSGFTLSAHSTSSAQHSTAQHDTAQHGHSTALHSLALYSTAPHIAAVHSTAQLGTSQHCTAQHCTTQQCTAQHSTPWHSTLVRHLVKYPLTLKSCAMRCYAALAVLCGAMLCCAVLGCAALCPCFGRQPHAGTHCHVWSYAVLCVLCPKSDCTCCTHHLHLVLSLPVPIAVKHPRLLTTACTLSVCTPCCSDAG